MGLVMAVAYRNWKAMPKDEQTGETKCVMVEHWKHTYLSAHFNLPQELYTNTTNTKIFMIITVSVSFHSHNMVTQCNLSLLNPAQVSLSHVAI
jgi:hypothetical protein